MKYVVLIMLAISTSITVAHAGYTIVRSDALLPMIVMLKSKLGCTKQKPVSINVGDILVEDIGFSDCNAGLMAIKGFDPVFAVYDSRADKQAAQNELISLMKIQARALASSAPAPKEATQNKQWEPSFDCKKASTSSERAICQDSMLGKLDGVLAANYKHISASDIGAGARNHLKKTQRAWLLERNRCTNNQCLIDLYRARIDEICDYPVISGVHPECTQSADIQ